MPSTPVCNGGDRGAEAKQSGRAAAAEAVPGELAGCVALQGSSETESAAGVEKRTFFTALALDEGGPGKEEGGQWPPHLGEGALGGSDSQMGERDVRGGEDAQLGDAQQEDEREEANEVVAGGVSGWLGKADEPMGIEPQPGARSHGWGKGAEAGKGRPVGPLR